MIQFHLRNGERRHDPEDPRTNSCTANSPQPPARLPARLPLGGGRPRLPV